MTEETNVVDKKIAKKFKDLVLSGYDTDQVKELNELYRDITVIVEKEIATAKAEGAREERERFKKILDKYRLDIGSLDDAEEVFYMFRDEIKALTTPPESTT